MQAYQRWETRKTRYRSQLTLAMNVLHAWLVPFGTASMGIFYQNENKYDFSLFVRLTTGFIT